jgi:hypothetical protein
VDPFFEKFIADLVKGAEASSGFVRGSKVNIEIQPDRGREVKLAAAPSQLLEDLKYLGLVGGTHAGMGAGIGALTSAIRGDHHMGRDALVGAGLGAGVGTLGGTFGRGGLDYGMRDVGNALSHAAKSPIGGAALGAGVGGLTGAIKGDDPREIAGDAARGAGLGAGFGAINQKLSTAYNKGAKAAAETFGIKEAFLGALAGIGGSIGGGMLARKALPKLTGFAGHAAEMGGQMLGGHIGSQLAPPPPPPQQPQQPMM